MFMVVQQSRPAGSEEEIVFNAGLADVRNRRAGNKDHLQAAPEAVLVASP